jgi:hypothetical protein
MGPVWRMPGAKPGVHTGNIFKGSQPADLPVQQAVKFELITNRGTWMLLGIEGAASTPCHRGRGDRVMQLSVNSVVVTDYCNLSPPLMPANGTQAAMQSRRDSYPVFPKQLK